MILQCSEMHMFAMFPAPESTASGTTNTVLKNWQYSLGTSVANKTH